MSNTAYSPSRNKYIDIAKYAAIVMVVIGHIIGELDVPRDTLNNFLHIVVNISHMPVFYFISGYFLYSELHKYSPSKIFLKKTKRLLIPYLIWSTISLIMNVALNTVKTHTLDWSAILNETVDIFIYSRSVWFLIELYLSISIILLCYKISQKNNKAFLVLLILVYILLYAFGPREILSFFKFRWLFPFMVLGYAFKSPVGKRIIDFWKSINLWQLISIPLIAIYVLLVMQNRTPENLFKISFTNFNAESIFDGLIYQIGSVFGMASVFSIATLLSKFNTDMLASRGTYSLDIYLIHMFLLHIIAIVWKIKLPAIINSIAYIIISFVIVELIYFICKSILRKLKIYRLSVGLK